MRNCALLEVVSYCFIKQNIDEGQKKLTKLPKSWKNSIRLLDTKLC